MKHFTAIESATATRWRYSFKIYQIKKNELIYVWTGLIQYASTRGEESEVMSELARLKLIPKKYEQGYYYTNAWYPVSGPDSRQTFKITYIVPANQK